MTDSESGQLARSTRNQRNQTRFHAGEGGKKQRGRGRNTRPESEGDSVPGTIISRSVALALLWIRRQWITAARHRFSLRGWVRWAAPPQNRGGFGFQMDGWTGGLELIDGQSADRRQRSQIQFGCVCGRRRCFPPRLTDRNFVTLHQCVSPGSESQGRSGAVQDW